MSVNNGFITSKEEDVISSDFSKQYGHFLHHDNTRNHINNLICEYTSHDDFRDRVEKIIEKYLGTVIFKEKVKEYSQEQIDETVFKTWKIVLFSVILPITIVVISEIVIRLILR